LAPSQHPDTSGVPPAQTVHKKAFNANNVCGVNKRGWQDWVGVRGKQVPWCEGALNDVIVGELITNTPLIGSNNLCD